MTTKTKVRILAWVAGALAALLVAPFLYPLSSYAPAKVVAPDADGRFLDADGTRVYVRTQAPDTRGPDGILDSIALRGRLLLVHGFGGSSANWDAVVPPLVEAGFAVASVDVPGFGSSDKRIDVATYSHAANAATLWKAVDLLAEQDAVFDGPWILVGHSMGGTVVAEMAAQRSEDTARVVLVDGAVRVRDGASASGGSPALRAVLSFPPAGRLAADAIDLALRFPGSLRGVLASALGREPTVEELASYRRPLQVPGTARALVAISRSGSDREAGVAGEALADSGVPVSLIWGTADTWIPIADGEALSALFDAPLHRIEGAAHLPMQSHPQAFLDAFFACMEEGAAP